MRAILIASLLAGGVAYASQEASDLKRQIEAQRQAVPDLDRLDQKRAVPDEITRLRSWLDEADALHAQQKWPRVREVLDRCMAQAELIRQKITAAQLIATASDKEAEVKRTREKTRETKAALDQAVVQKKALDMSSK